MKTRRTCWQRGRGAVLGAAILTLVGCEAPTKHELLTFFFDGVPSDQVGTRLPTHRPEEDAQRGQPGARASQTEDASKAEPRAFLHAPFENRQCEACHESMFSQKLRTDLLESCFACHRVFLQKAKFKHAPAESGDCTTCHDPHQSPEKFLLTRPGQQLCLECHDKSEMVRVAGHKTMGHMVCQQCHDPHKGEDKYFLKNRSWKPAPRIVSAR